MTSPPWSLPVSSVGSRVSFRGRVAEAHARPVKDPRVTLAVVELTRGGEAKRSRGVDSGFSIGRSDRLLFLFLFFIVAVLPFLEIKVGDVGLLRCRCASGVIH